MSRSGPRKPYSRSPKLVIHPSVFRGDDEKLRAFIDEWFVPAAVEDYIRSRSKLVDVEKPAEPDHLETENRDTE